MEMMELLHGMNAVAALVLFAVGASWLKRYLKQYASRS